MNIRFISFIILILCGLMLNGVLFVLVFITPNIINSMPYIMIFVYELYIISHIITKNMVSSWKNHGTA